jgi:hypothetical protein
MKRAKRLTKKERKALNPRPQADAAHTHCVACGRHIDASEFQAPEKATRLVCQHGSRFASCVGCVPQATALLAEHDRTGKPVQEAGAWH